MAGTQDVPEPPEDYEMSPRFQEWVLERMRVEVAQQIGAAGLDRMAVVRGANGSEEAEQGAEAEEGRTGAGAGDGEADEPA